MANIEKPTPGVPKDALRAFAQVWQEDGRWVIHIADLPEWLVKEINRENYMSFENHSSKEDKEFIKLVSQKFDC